MNLFIAVVMESYEQIKDQGNERKRTYTNKSVWAHVLKGVQAYWRNVRRSKFSISSFFTYKSDVHLIHRVLHSTLLVPVDMEADGELALYKSVDPTIEIVAERDLRPAL